LCCILKSPPKLGKIYHRWQPFAKPPWFAFSCHNHRTWSRSSILTTLKLRNLGLLAGCSGCWPAHSTFCCTSFSRRTSHESLH
jgi:hypothetical protein